MAKLQKDLLKDTAIQILNEMSIEYDFSIPTYLVESLRLQPEIQPPQANCGIF